MSVNLAKCAVLGAGTMGGQIALSLALGGAEVALWGRREEALHPALQRCRDGFDFLVDQGLAEASERKAVLARLRVTADLANAVSAAGFVIEAVAEDIGLKQTILRQAETAADENAILSSTTSALSATEMQSALKNPGHFCIAHYAQPAHIVELVEVVAGKASSEHTITETTRILRQTGKIPVTCPDIPGFLWARIQHAVLREFATLVGSGLVTAEACDRVLKTGYAARLPAMGAFEHADLAGLDLITSDAARAVWADLSTVTDPCETLIGDLFRQGRLGMKSGQGFYDWKQRDSGAFKRRRDEEIIRRIKINRGGEVK